jgi:hypothetical protein
MPFGSQWNLLIDGLLQSQHAFPGHPEPSGISSIVTEDGDYIFDQDGVNQLIGEV